MTRDELLQILSQIESSGGQNFNHPTITHGPDQGTQAIGRYGLTSATVDDTVNKNPALQSAYGNILSPLDPMGKKQYLESHPDVEQNIAGTLADRLSQRYGGDENKVAYAWNHGSYLNPNKITPDVLAKDDYTNKFQKLKTKFADSGTPSASAPVQQQFVAQQNAGGPQRKMASNDGTPSGAPKMSLEDIINDPANPFNEKDDDSDQGSDDELTKLKASLLASNQ
jgi:hypothetical protein